MGVAFEEFDGSPTVRFSDGRFQGLRRLKVAWEDRFDLLIELYGGYRNIGGQLSFTPPATFPEVPQAVPATIEIDPFPPEVPDGSSLVSISQGSNHYPWAVVSVRYQIPLVGGDQDRSDLPTVPQGTHLSYRSDLSTEYESLPGRTWRWNVDGNALPGDVDARVLLPTEEFVLSWHRVPMPPWEAIRDLRGLVNQSEFLSYPPETVLFMGARTQRDFQIRDTNLWRLDYYFKARAVASTASGQLLDGWNRRYRQEAASDEHWLLIEDADGNSPYRTGNLEQLFSFSS